VGCLERPIGESTDEFVDVTVCSGSGHAIDTQGIAAAAVSPHFYAVSPMGLHCGDRPRTVAADQGPVGGRRPKRHARRSPVKQPFELDDGLRSVARVVLRRCVDQLA
jgi:hypothetical protein